MLPLLDKPEKGEGDCEPLETPDFVAVKVENPGVKGLAAREGFQSQTGFIVGLGSVASIASEAFSESLCFGSEPAGLAPKVNALLEGVVPPNEKPEVFDGGVGLPNVKPDFVDVPAAAVGFEIL